MSLSVLLVDDEQKKLEALVEALIAGGISRESIDVAQSAFAARGHLRTKKYDLMLVDLALPERPENIPDFKVGFALLGEVFESPVIVPPDHVVAITGSLGLRVGEAERRVGG